MFEGSIGVSLLSTVLAVQNIEGPGLASRHIRSIPSCHFLLLNCQEERTGEKRSVFGRCRAESLRRRTRGPREDVGPIYVEIWLTAVRARCARYFQSLGGVAVMLNQCPNFSMVMTLSLEALMHACLNWPSISSHISRREFRNWTWYAGKGSEPPIMVRRSKARVEQERKIFMRLYSDDNGKSEHSGTVKSDNHLCHCPSCGYNFKVLGSWYQAHCSTSNFGNVCSKQFNSLVIWYLGPNWKVFNEIRQ